MKINADQALARGRKIPSVDTKSTAPAQNKSFTDLMHQQDERRSKEQFNQLLQQIDQQGERLTRSMTIRELRQYRLLVKQFLEQTVKAGITLKEVKGWDRRGRGKKYQLIEEIDSKLLEMADELLLKESGRVEILDRIGNIKGLLLNLYF